MFVRSLCPLPSGVSGVTEAELFVASFVPDAGYTLEDAESGLQRLEPPDWSERHRTSRSSRSAAR